MTPDVAIAAAARGAMRAAGKHRAADERLAQAAVARSVKHANTALVGYRNLAEAREQNVEDLYPQKLDAFMALLHLAITALTALALFPALGDIHHNHEDEGDVH